MPRNQGTSRKGKPRKNDRAAGMGRALERATTKRYTPTSHTGGMAAVDGVKSLNNISEKSTSAAAQSSILDMDDLSDFITQAEMSQREFQSEKERFVVLDATSTKHSPTTISWNDNNDGTTSAASQPLPTVGELSLPRRPPWNESTTPSELDKLEKESFLNWRRHIAQQEESLYAALDSHSARTSLLSSITPFEKNLEMWRQLWRVCERSDLIIQIVDGRDVGFYLSEDLRRYVCEELGKRMVVLVNKSDYLTEGQRRAWSEELGRGGWVHFFYSAFEEQRVLDGENDDDDSSDDDENESDDDDGDDNEGEETKEDRGKETKEEDNPKQPLPQPTIDTIGLHTPLTRHQLLHQLSLILPSTPSTTPLTYGTVGFPNVGKSSLINTLLAVSKNDHSRQRVAVASQPGKTKHFQTLRLPDTDITLCDCPGLVFPALARSRADLICGGVFPIAQMREGDYRKAMELIVERIPTAIFNAVYGMVIPAPYGVEEVLTAFCKARSFFSSAGNGVCDFQRAGRYIVKDYVTGKLLYVLPPNPVGGDEEMLRSFERDTLRLLVKRTKKLRHKLEKEGHVIETDDVGGMAAVETTTDGDGDDDDDDVTADLSLGVDDIDLLDAVGASFPQEEQKTEGKRGKKHKTMKKWGKKNRKLRDNDPYGCHTDDADDLLNDNRDTGTAKMTAGVIVKGGKYGKKGYTRPNYAGVKSAVPFENVNRPAKERKSN